MNSNYGAEIQVTSIPDEQLVSGKFIEEYLYEAGQAIIIQHCSATNKTAYQISNHH